ncbi:MAG: hypothetical protein FWF63_08835 [Fibromonadales bacterium]|nr:hypothetical protein [Fibromonadales bacterium]
MKREADPSDDDVDIFTVIGSSIRNIIYSVCCCFGAIVAIVFLVKFIFWLW